MESMQAGTAAKGVQRARDLARWSQARAARQTGAAALGLEHSCIQLYMRGLRLMGGQQALTMKLGTVVALCRCATTAEKSSGEVKK